MASAAGWLNRLQQHTIEYLGHYHEERNHQGLGNELIQPIGGGRSAGGVVCRERLGGLLRFHKRAA